MMTVQPRKIVCAEGNCGVCFKEKAVYRAVLKHSGRVVKSRLICEKCLSVVGTRLFFNENGWETERI